MSNVSKIFASISSFLKKRWKLLLLIALVILAVVWYLQRRANNQPKLSFINPSHEDIVSSVTVSGRVDAKEKARLRFAAGGKVVYLGAKEGDSVKKWQTIATIDRAALQKQLQQNLNTYMQERNDFENTRDNIKDRAIDTKENRGVQNQQFDLNNKVINVEMQNIAITNTTLSAPFAGLLTVAPTAVPGVQLLATDYFELVNPETLIFHANLDEVDLQRISLGQPAQILLDAYDGQPIESYVSYISYTSSESSTGTVFLVEFPLNSQDINRYRLGMNGDALIRIAQKRGVLTIPIACISERDGKVFVNVKADNKEQKTEREIKVGLENEDKIEVLSGLSEGDQVVLPE